MNRIEAATVNLSVAKGEWNKAAAEAVGHIPGPMLQKILNHVRPTVQAGNRATLISSDELKESRTMLEALQARGMYGAAAYLQKVVNAEANQFAAQANLGRTTGGDVFRTNRWNTPATVPADQVRVGSPVVSGYEDIAVDKPVNGYERLGEGIAAAALLYGGYKILEDARRSSENRLADKIAERIGRQPKPPAPYWKRP